MIFNFLSPIWDKIVSMFFEKIDSLLIDKYRRASRKNKIIVIIIGITIIIGCMAGIYMYYNKKDISIINMELHNTQEQVARVDFTLKNDNPDSDVLIERVHINIKEYYEMLDITSNSDNVDGIEHIDDDEDRPIEYCEKSPIPSDSEKWIVLEDEEVPLGWLDTSHIYEVVLEEPDKITDKQILIMSQIIPAKGYDKFTLDISEKGSKPIILRLEFEFMFDDGECVKSEECVLLLGSILPGERIRMYEDTSTEIELGNAAENYNELKRFEEYGCKYVSDYFFKVLDSYKDIVNDSEVY